MDFADWLNINCDLIAEPADKSCIGYKFAEGLGGGAPVTRRLHVSPDDKSNGILSMVRTIIIDEQALSATHLVCVPPFITV